MVPCVYDTISGREVDHVGIELNTKVNAVHKMKVQTFVYIDGHKCIGYWVRTEWEKHTDD